MKLKKFTLVMVFASLYAVTLWAQPPVLGDDILYYKGSDLRAHPNYQLHGEGNLGTVSEFWRRNVYADGDYAVVKMGIQALQNADGLFIWRSGFQVRENTQGVFRISKDNPVIAVKLRMPRGEHLSYLTGDGNQLLCEYQWKNPTTGTDGNMPPYTGKPVHIRQFPYLKDYLGRD